MFYIMYLTGLCQRRHWPEPLYDIYRTRQGYSCTVRVNNREYTTDEVFDTDDLARNAAATRAYMICRNFSVNDGMYPGQRQGQGGIIQGLPVAIGTGRRNTQSSIHDSDSGSTGSGGSSPRSSDSGMVSHNRPSSKPSNEVCCCRRDYVWTYDRCRGCLRAHGYNV